MGIRDLQLYRPDSGTVVSPDHVLGVDESGTRNDSRVFCLAAVLCPQSKSPTLAEWMIDAGLEPWDGKPSERAFYDSPLPDRIDTTDWIDWFVVAATDPLGVRQKAAAATTAAKYTLVQPWRDTAHRLSPIALVHDGGESMYGTKQRRLREQAAVVFDSDFRAEFGDIFVTQSPGADSTYPPVMVADALSGHVRRRIQAGTTSPEYNDRLAWYNDAWGSGSPRSADDFYRLGGPSVSYDDRVWENYATWLLSSDHDDSETTALPTARLLNRTESTTISSYLAERE